MCPLIPPPHTLHTTQINNLAPPQQLGLVVSTAQAVACAIRTVGPAFGGALFSLAMAQEAAGAWRLEAVYAPMALLALLTGVLSFRIPAACDEPPETPGRVAANGNVESF